MAPHKDINHHPENAQTETFDSTPFQLSDQHLQAVDHRRRIVVQYDAYNTLDIDFETWIKFRFAYVDEPNSQIDSIWWDINPMGPAIYPGPPNNPQLESWQKLGIDWVGRIIDETRKRGLEVFWSHRISEVDIHPSGRGAAWKESAHPFKQSHPGWVLETWWPHGLWNYAVPEVRQFKVDVLRQIAETYNLNGFQLDFARHIPCLPPGRQWELRHHVTQFVRMVRTMLLDVAQQRGQPILLAARVPRNLDGCRIDGFDITAWAQQNLVDILTLGTRSINVDIAGYREATAGSHIKLQPCHDDHHATDAYQYPPIAFFRGVFANWWQQGADSVVTFNWHNAPPEICSRVGTQPGPPSHQQAYHEVGNPDTLLNKDKIFVVERRGGYPWAEGYFNRNDTASLPAKLNVDGAPVSLTIRISDDLPSCTENLKKVTLRIILFAALSDDKFEVNLSGTALQEVARDPNWKDRQIFSPQPQPASGGADRHKVNPNQKLLRLDFAVDPQTCNAGLNPIEIRLVRQAPETNDVVLEKLEVHVNYI